MKKRIFITNQRSKIKKIILILILILFASNVSANEEPAGDPVDANTPYLKFRVELGTPFTLKPGKMPNVQVAFDLANAVQFDDAAACLVWPNAPAVSITFVE